MNAFQEAQLLLLKIDLPARIKGFTRTTESEKEVFKSRINRGTAYLKTGNLGAALIEFEAAAYLGEEPGRASFYRGIAHINKDDYQEAVKNFNKALRKMRCRQTGTSRRGRAEGCRLNKVYYL